MRTPIAILSLVTLAASAAPTEMPGMKEITATLLPPPRAVTPGEGTLTLTRATTIKFDPACAKVGAHFAARLRRGTGWPVPVADPAVITLAIAPGLADASPEAHTIHIRGSGIIIRSATAAGLARCTQTFMELMPPPLY